MLTLKDQIRTFIIEELLFGDGSRMLGDEDSLIEHDVVDSTGILELVAFVEDRFGVTVEDVEILPENFDSIARVAGFVLRKRTIPGDILAAE